MHIQTYYLHLKNNNGIKIKMSKSKKTSEYSPATLKTIADFLVEDYRFCRSFESAIKRIDNEELKKRYLSSYAFHSDITS